MPRINQLPIASSVAQTDVLAIDTPDKTYQVPRSVLAPSPYIATIPTGQWSGSGSDYYITVTASNVTTNSLLYPFFDSASEALLNGPVWAVPAAGSFTIHTSAIPAGTVTISVLLAGVVGEAQYQVLSDVYSKSQVDSIVAQSTAMLNDKLKNRTNLFSGSTTPDNSTSYALSEAYTNFEYIMITARTNTDYQTMTIKTDDISSSANYMFSAYQNNQTGLTTSFSYMATCLVTFTDTTHFKVNGSWTNANWILKPVNVWGINRK